MNTKETKARVEELKDIRDSLEIYAALCEVVEGRKSGDSYYDQAIYRMFGSLNSAQARAMARGITFAMGALEIG